LIVDKHDAQHATGKHMWNPQTMESMPGFWPPKANRAWRILLEPLRRHYLHNYFGISKVVIHRASDWGNQIKPDDGVLLAPNHSHDSDPHVMMEAGRQLNHQLYFMAAWQVFLDHHGLDGFVMQRMGAFSVDREGCDRRAMKQAIELLTTGRWLVVFPEGEIYHTNERLTPLREGVAFMTVSAQRDLEKEKSDRQVWVVPVSIRYQYDDDIMPKLEDATAEIERRFLLRRKPGATLPQRMIALGEVLLTIKEKEQLGKSMEGADDLRTRLSRLIHHVLSRHENQEFHKVRDEESVPVRVKNLRRHFIDRMFDAECSDDEKRHTDSALADLHLVLQLYSYPGDYIAADPTPERMAETLDKFEEDLGGVAKIKGKRTAYVTLGEPLDVKRHTTGRARAAATELTARIEESITGLLHPG
jgi:1-acyl-sn-glycerol-3-phosphate acyltransferase